MNMNDKTYEKREIDKKPQENDSFEDNLFGISGKRDVWDYFIVIVKETA